MGNETYFLVMILFVVIFVFGLIFRLISNRYKPNSNSKKDEVLKSLGFGVEKSAINKDCYSKFVKKINEDPVTNPGYSSLECNIFHKDRYED